MTLELCEPSGAEPTAVRWKGGEVGHLHLVGSLKTNAGRNYAIFRAIVHDTYLLGTFVQLRTILEAVCAHAERGGAQGAANGAPDAGLSGEWLEKHEHGAYVYVPKATTYPELRGAYARVGADAIGLSGKQPVFWGRLLGRWAPDGDGSNETVAFRWEAR